MNPSFRKAPAGATDSSANWLIIFTDVVALMLAFFVMMYATQKVETGGWQAMVQSLSQSLRVDRLQAKLASAPKNVEQHDLPSAIDLSYLQNLIEGMRGSELALADVIMTREDDRLIIAIPGDLLFDAGRADPMPRAEPRIRLFADIFRNLSNRIDVLGHSVSRPLSGQVFESNRDARDPCATPEALKTREEPTSSFGRRALGRGYASTEHAAELALYRVHS